MSIFLCKLIKMNFVVIYFKRSFSSGCVRCRMSSFLCKFCTIIVIYRSFIPVLKDDVILLKMFFNYSYMACWKGVMDDMLCEKELLTFPAPYLKGRTSMSFGISFVCVCVCVCVCYFEIELYLVEEEWLIFFPKQNYMKNLLL